MFGSIVTISKPAQTNDTLTAQAIFAQIHACCFLLTANIVPDQMNTSFDYQIVINVTVVSERWLNLFLRFRKH